MAPSVESSRTRTPSPTRPGPSTRSSEEKVQPAAPSAPPAGGPFGGRPSEPPYTHGFFDKDPVSVAMRKAFIKATAANTVAIVLMIWGILAIYWGSTWKARAGAHNLHGWIVDFDGGVIGQTVTQTFMNSNGPKTSMTWFVKPASDFPSGVSDMIERVYDEKAWAIVAINPGVSDRLNAAISSADASYNATSVVSAFAVQARNENAYRDLVAPNIQANVARAGQTFAAQQARRLATSSNVGTILSTAPQVILQPISYIMDPVRPFDVPVATAVDFVGLIYLMIIAFNIVMAGVGIRMQTGMERRLTLKSYVLLRMAVPTVSYFFLALAIALLSKFFLVPFDRKFGPGGFIVYWLLSWFSMLSLGLALEAVITLITARFIAFFLILWIIVNVSVCFYPVEILPTIFRYGYATPFYNINTAIRAIIFDTRNRVGMNFGILIAWTALSAMTLPLFAWFVRRRDIAAARAAQAAPPTAPPTVAHKETA